MTFHAQHKNQVMRMDSHRECPPSQNEEDATNAATEYLESPLHNWSDNIRSSMEVAVGGGDAEATSSDIIFHTSQPTSGRSAPTNDRRESKRFVTKLALISTVCSVFLLFILAALFSEWSVKDIFSSSTLGLQNYGQYDHERQLSKHQWGDDNEFAGYNEFSEYTTYDVHNHRNLEQEDNNNNDENNNNNADAVSDGDYSSYRCDEIFVNTPSPKYDSSNKRCEYAKTCDGGDGLLLPFVFCQIKFLSTGAWFGVLSPILLMGITLLFRLLGSTADEYFSPSLEMFSFKLGLPPRFAGVTLLALGNGAADVSATINAIASDPGSGYKMSLGALTGAAMFITTVIAGSVIVTNGGMVCRGALVRDVTALAVTLVVVALTLEKGEISPGTERLFITIYVLFVLIVLIADVYHRAVMLPRIQHETEMKEHQRQLEAERVASMRAGDSLNAFAGASSTSMGGDASSVGPPTALGGQGGDIAADDDRTHATAPPAMEDTMASGSNSPGKVKNRALNAVLTALSNYNDDEQDEFENEDTRSRPSGWGVDCTIEGSKSWDQPIVLHGADGILTRHPHHHPQQTEEEDGVEFQSSPYRVMEDLDLVDRMCVQEGSLGHPAYNWAGAYHDGKQELIVHFRESWRDILDDDESGMVEKFLLICEFPMTVARKLTVSIPCEGSYCRALVALSFALSPLWVGVYVYENFGVDLWGWKMGVIVGSASFVGLLILRYAPGGDGTMATMFAAPIALYGFIIAAFWIDWLADKLVTVLEFLGVLLRIPNSILGLTILAWGNSTADLSANLTMARKGLANMAITACFAGPVFNILIGLGVGFGVLRGVTNTEVNYVTLTPSITTGFVFCFINCGLFLVVGLAVNKGVIPPGYGYIAFVIYAVYIATSLLLQFLL